MENYLYHKDLFLPLGGVAKKPMAMKDEEWDILDRRDILGSVGGFQYFKRKDNEGFDGRVG